MTATHVSVVRGLTVMVVAAFLAVLGWYLSQPGYTQTRLLLFAFLGGVAIVGAAGIVSQRELVAAGGACGLLLLGFWQAVLWIYVSPVVGLLAVAAVVISNHKSSTTPSGE